MFFVIFLSPKDQNKNIEGYKHSVTAADKMLQIALCYIITISFIACCTNK